MRYYLSILILFVSFFAKAQYQPLNGGSFDSTTLSTRIGGNNVVVTVRNSSLAGQWYWSNTSTATPSSTVVQVTGVSTGRWIKIPTSGGGNPNSNAGNGYRLAIPGTNNVRTLIPGFGVVMDSATNTINVYVDSNTVIPIPSTLVDGAELVHTASGWRTRQTGLPEVLDANGCYTSNGYQICINANGVTITDTATGLNVYQFTTDGIRNDHLNDGTGIARMATVTNGVFGFQNIPSGSSSGGGTHNYYPGSGLYSVNDSTFAVNDAYINSKWVSLTGSYNNPVWLNSLAYSKLTGAPTTLSQFTNDAGYIDDIGGLVQAGTGVTITGAGTQASPYVINSTATGGATGNAGGDLSGTYPNPSVIWANGYPTYDGRYQALGSYEITSNKVNSFFSPGSTSLYPTTKAVVDYITGQGYETSSHAAATYQPSGSYEVTTNKATSLASPNNTTYPTTQAVKDSLVVKAYQSDLNTTNANVAANTAKINTKQNRLVAGTNITITNNADSTATISSTGGSGTTPTLQQVTTQGNTTNGINFLRQPAATPVPAQGNTLFDSAGIRFRDSANRTLAFSKALVTPGTTVTDSVPNKSGVVLLNNDSSAITNRSTLQRVLSNNDSANLPIITTNQSQASRLRGSYSAWIGDTTVSGQAKLILSVWGDSYTAGSYYKENLAQALNMTLDPHGLAGTNLGQLVSGTPDSSIEYRIINQFPSGVAANYGYVVIAGTTNDAASIADTTKGRASYVNIINSLTSKGISANQIVLATSGFGNPVNTGVQATRRNYVAMTKNVARQYGTYVADWYGAIEQAGGVAVERDGLHPNDDGAQVLTNSFFLTTTGAKVLPNAHGGTLVVNGPAMTSTISINQATNSTDAPFIKFNDTTAFATVGPKQIAQLDINPAKGYMSLTTSAWKTWTTKTNNTYFGIDVNNGVTTGNNNTAIGYRALYNSTSTASNQTGVGSQALSGNTQPNATGAGVNSGLNNTGSAFTGVGYNSGSGNGGTNTTAIGTNVLSGSNTGSGNVGIGPNSLLINTSGAMNLGIGTSTLSRNTTGSRNIALDQSAGANNVTGNDIFAIGNASGGWSTSLATLIANALGSGYTSATVAFSGGGTGATLPTATATVSGGQVTGYTIVTPGSNITAALTVTVNGDGTGATANYTLETGQNNIAIGTSAGAFGRGKSNLLYIGHNVANNAAYYFEANKLRIGYNAVDSLNLITGNFSTTNTAAASVKVNGKLQAAQVPIVTSPTYLTTYDPTDSTFKRVLASSFGGSGGGTVTTVSVNSANGFAGTVANATTTPAITLSTTVTGLLKGNGTALSAAVAGTDYQAPYWQKSGTTISQLAKGDRISIVGSGASAGEQTGDYGQLKISMDATQNEAINISRCCIVAAPGNISYAIGLGNNTSNLLFGLTRSTSSSASSFTEANAYFYWDATSNNLAVNGGYDVKAISTAPTPAAGHAVFWMDSSSGSVKVTKNVGGTITTAVIY